MMWRRIIFSLIILLFTRVLFGIPPDTTRNFKFGGFAVLTLNQVKLSHWVAGGENAMSATGIGNLYFNYARNKTIWENTLDASYGVIKNESSKLEKNTDKFEFNSKFGTQAANKIYYSVLLNYRSQFNKGYTYPNTTDIISRFNAPGYVSLALGMDYKPSNFFDVFLSPVSGRLVLVNDQKLADAGAYGVDSALHQNGLKIKNGKRTWFNFGATLSTYLKKDLSPNINVMSKLLLFNNFTDKNKENRKSCDFTWGMLLNIKASKIITTTIQFDLIYDKDAIDKVQYKESFGIGVSYKF